MKMAASLLWLLVLVVTAEAQQEYPRIILGGKSYRVPASRDTLWVVEHQWYKEAIKCAKRAKLDAEIELLLEHKIELKDSLVAEKDSIIATYEKGYVHYRDLWEKQSLELEEAEIKASRRWRFLQVGFIGGAIAGALVVGLR